MPPLLWTPDEAAADLKVFHKTLQRLRNRGLPYVMISSGTCRYCPDDLTISIEDRVQQSPTALKARASGTSTSKSGVVDFTVVAARITTRKRKQ